MTDDHAKRVGGRGFSPSERNVDEHDDETTTITHGGGKQFAKDVGDPDTDESARQTEGSGKQFAWQTRTEPDEPEPDEQQTGSGKQFRPGNEDR